MIDAPRRGSGWPPRAHRGRTGAVGSTRRAELQREEEHWGKQLARDQQASAMVARDISRYEARAVALHEAERTLRIDRSALR